MKTIKAEHLINEDNHVNCECGNVTIDNYSWSSSDGSTSCPICMVNWQSEQIKAMKQLIYSLSPLRKEEVDRHINKKYAEMMGVRLSDFDDEMDFSLSEMELNELKGE